jgi:hypothetical protein
LLERHLHDLVGGGRRSSREEEEVAKLIALVLTEVHCQNVMLTKSFSSNVNTWMETPLFVNGLSDRVMDEEKTPSDATRELLDKLEDVQVPRAQLRSIEALLKKGGVYGNSGWRLLRWSVLSAIFYSHLYHCFFFIYLKD